MTAHARATFLRAGRAGALGGFGVIYLAMVGMTARFDSLQLVGESITLGMLTLIAPFFAAGYIVTRPRVIGGERVVPTRSDMVRSSLVAGAVGGLVAALWVLLLEGLGQAAVRTIFVAVTPEMLDIVTFSLVSGIAAIAMIALGTAFSALGAAVRLIPTAVGRPLFIATVAVGSAAMMQRVIPPALAQLGLQTRWLYVRGTRGLTWTGAALIAVVTIAIVVFARAKGPALRARYDSLEGSSRTGFRSVSAILIVALVLILPWVVGSVLSNTLGRIGIFMLMALGLNIVVGFAGLLDLGYVAFFASGAYATAVLTGGNLVGALGDTMPPAVGLSLSWYVALPLVVAFSALVGLMIGAPVLRLRGDYLAIVTLGFGEIARILITSEWLKPLVGGAQGMRDIPPAPIAGFGLRDPQVFYYLVLAVCAAAIYITWRLKDARVGRAWAAMREDEQVAAAMGVSTTRYKLLAFAMGGAIGSLSGALFAVQVGSLTPNSFVILVSITVLATVILGGMGSIKGVIAGTFVLIGLPLVLTEFEEFRLLIYGGVLVAIMILRPGGLIPSVSRVEVGEVDRAQDKWFDKATPGAEA